MKLLLIALLLVSSLALAQKPLYIMDSNDIGKKPLTTIAGTLLLKKTDKQGRDIAVFVNVNSTYRVWIRDKSVWRLIDPKKREVYVFNNLRLTYEK